MNDDTDRKPQAVRRVDDAVTSQSPEMIPQANVGGKDAPEAPAVGARRSARLGWIMVLFGFVGFVLWAALAPLAQGIPAPGKVVVEGQRQAVQAVIGGRIAALHARDGDRVEAGDLLLELDSGPIRAARVSAFAQWASAQAEHDRLESELLEADTVTFDPRLVALEAEPAVTRAMALQNQLFISRRLLFDNEMAAFSGNIRGLTQQIAAIDRSMASREREIGMLAGQIESLAPLATEGYVSRNRVLENERSLAQAEGALASMQSEQGRLMTARAETELEMTRRRDDLRRENQQKLNEMRQVSEETFSRLQAADYDLGSAEIRAPAPGVVVGSKVHTVGGVVQSGQQLMEVVPVANQLDIEAQVEVHLIDSVREGLPVDLMFSALDLNRTPVVFGEVLQVSADRLIDEATRTPYFKVIVRVNEDGAEQLQGQTVRPGMPVDVFIKTGERSLMTYLLKPLIDRSSTALTER